MALIGYTKHGEAVSSDLSLEQVKAELGKLAVTNSFAASLLASANGRGLSLAQAVWAHKLALEAINAVKVVEVAKIELPNTINAAKIVTLFGVASAWLKRPRLTVQVGEAPVVRFALAGHKARFPGTVNVTDDTGFGGKFYGRIHLDGRFQPTVSCTEDVLNAVCETAADPITVAAEHGRRTGCCAFCARDLTDERSTIHGYGPICAKKWSLPWGLKPVIQYEEVAVS